MRSLLSLLVIFLFVLGLWVTSNFWTFNRKNYIDEKVLELSIPFDVKIDIEFIEGFKPADE